jgi:uncharacterized membrane protein YbhN (UPF0104 family)
MSRAAQAWARTVGGAAILAFVVWRLGAGPLLDGIRTISVPSILAALAITAVTTVCSAWRWAVVARGLAVDLPLPTAVAGYYRSQFLNTVLPGGVLGDVHRGIRHGRDIGTVARALRAVGWERVAGQLVQVGLAIAVLLAFPSPMRFTLRQLIPVLVLCALGAAVVLRLVPTSNRRWVAAIRDDVSRGLLARSAWPRITLASTVVVAGHAAIFVIAARTAGSAVPTAQVLPLIMVVLLAMAVPANVAGWGPREGATAWAFGAAGLGAAQGVAVATVYGVLVFIACLPGAAVLMADRWWRGGPAEAAPNPSTGGSAASHGPVTADDPEGALHV